MKKYTTAELRRELAKFEQEMVSKGYADNSVHTYVDRAGRFLAWLDGDFELTQQGKSLARKRLDTPTRLQATQSHRRGK